MLRIRRAKNINLYLFSKETIIEHKNLGILPNLLDIQNVPDLMSNEKFWMKISIPKEATIFELRQYISFCSGIPESLILLYTYVMRDLKNSYKNLLKRNEFKMHLIEDSAMNELLVQTIYSYNENKTVFNRPIFIYVDIAMKKNKLELGILEENIYYETEKDKNQDDIPELEYIIDEDSQKIIYTKLNNYWVLKKNEVYSDEIISDFKYNLEDYNNCKLFIKKDFDLNSNSLRIINAFSLPCNKTKDSIILDEIIKNTLGSEENFYNYVNYLERIKKELISYIFLETTGFENDTISFLIHEHTKLFD